jgi:hypothetical protein
MSSTRDIIWIKNDRAETIVNVAQNIDSMRELLNTTGRGFCLAKFTQLTLHLGTGTVHSCHHPPPHAIPLHEVERSSTALFNTEHLVHARRQMLAGERPSECDYCWRVEDSSSTAVSDRYLKSLDPSAFSDHDSIIERGADTVYAPRYLEVDFGNVCNFRCTYCGPEFSSTWVEDLKRHGPIKLLQNTNSERWAQGWQDLDNLVYLNREVNPYLVAYWEWFPEIYSHLRVFRITGGEPLLSKETYRTIDWLIANPNPDLEFAINSNLGVTDNLWDNFVERITTLTRGDYVKKFTLYASLDAWGARAEYARPGLHHETFRERVEQLLELGNIRVVIMCTFNIFSITSIRELLEWQLELKRKYNWNKITVNFESDTGYSCGESARSHTERLAANPSHTSMTAIDIAYIRHPEYLDARICTPDLVQDYLIPTLNWMSSNVFINAWGSDLQFTVSELEKFKRIVVDRAYSTNTHTNYRAMFYDFVNEQDSRHGTNFCETFPEMKHFYSVCKEARETIT